MKTVCFTGHRQLKGSYLDFDRMTPEWAACYETLKVIVHDLRVQHNCYRFITGGALGVDQAAAEAVLAHKTMLGLHHTVARPFPSQACKWPPKSQSALTNIIIRSDNLVDVSADPYHPSKMHMRNHWMVDHSDIVVAVWKGTVSGGTWECLQYAMSKKKPILVYDPYKRTMEWHV